MRYEKFREPGAQLILLALVTELETYSCASCCSAVRSSRLSTSLMGLNTLWVPSWRAAKVTCSWKIGDSYKYCSVFCFQRRSWWKRTSNSFTDSGCQLYTPVRNAMSRNHTYIELKIFSEVHWAETHLNGCIGIASCTKVLYFSGSAIRNSKGDMITYLQANRTTRYSVLKRRITADVGYFQERFRCFVCTVS